FFSSRRRHTRFSRDWSSERVLFRSNPGNSGGPLLDSADRLIGINTAIYSPSGASAGIGFAVPVDTVMRVVPQLIKTGKYIRPAQIGRASCRERVSLSAVAVSWQTRG